MALGSLFLIFVCIGIISILGVALLFFLENETAQKVVLWLMAIWSIGIAAINATSQPTNFVFQQAMSWVIGGVGIVGALLSLKLTEKKAGLIPRFLVAGSVLVGFYYLFLS